MHRFCQKIQDLSDIKEWDYSETFQSSLKNWDWNPLEFDSDRRDFYGAFIFWAEIEG